MVKNDPFSFHISGLSWKFKNRLDEVNCIEVSYKPHPWVTLYSKRCEL